MPVQELSPHSTLSQPSQQQDISKAI